MDAEGRRCRRQAAKRSGDLFVCREHCTLWKMLLIEDHYSVATRKMLAHSRWTCAREGQALIAKRRAA
jgi:hypothetical protein